MKPGLLLIIFLPLAAWGVLQDIANTAKGGSIDLRNRVTGARIASAKLDPYSYKWKRGDPEEFCDIYNEPGGLLSKTTVTPWVLAAHAPFNSMNYRSTQWLWFFLQYGMIAAGILAWIKCQSGGVVRWGIVLVLMYSVTPSWRHHVDHGQIYVVYAAMLLFLYRISQRTVSTGLAITEGMLGAFALGSRPTLLGQFVEPYKKRRWISLAGAGFGLVVVFVIPVLLFGPPIWNYYRWAMEAHSESYLLQMKPARAAISYPGTIEGIPLDTIAGFSRTIPFADTSIFRMISFNLPAKLTPLFWAILMGGALLYMAVRKVSTDLIWWAVAAWIMVGDFLLPAFRHTYNDVLALPMVLFGLSALSGRKGERAWIYLSASALILMILSWWDKLPKSFLPVPSVAWFLLAVGGVVWALVIAKNETSVTDR